MRTPAVTAFPNRALAALALPLFFLGAGLAARADVVLVGDGDRISGVIVEISDGTLTMTTDYAGTLRISWKKITGVQTDKPVQLRLNDDSVVKGRILGTENGNLKFQEEDKPAPREIPKDGIVQLNEPGVVWHGNITVAGKVENGNSNSKNLFIQAELVMESENYRALVRGNFSREKTDGVLSEDNYFAVAKLDRHLSLESFAYISNEARRDRFEDLQYRDVTSVGLGYTFVKSDAVVLWVEAGPAIVVEELSDGTSDVWFAGRFGLHGTLALPLGLELRDDFVIWPNFDDWVNWQLHNEATLSTRILQGIHVSFAIITDHDNQPSSGRKSTDNTFVIGISHKF